MSLIPTCEHGYRLEDTGTISYACPSCSKMRDYARANKPLPVFQRTADDEIAQLKQRLLELEERNNELRKINTFIKNYSHYDSREDMYGLYIPRSDIFESGFNGAILQERQRTWSRIVKTGKLLVSMRRELAALKEQTRVRVTAAEPPAEKDAVEGQVLAFSNISWSWEACGWIYVIEHADEFERWYPLPPPQEVGE